MKLDELIADAFALRKCPDDVVPLAHPDTCEYSDAKRFRGFDWHGTTCEQWSKYPDAIYGFTPDAFCYFLPGILSAQIKENYPDLLVNSSIIGMLDRSDSVEFWDAFFVERWPLLSQNECLAVQEWVLWLSSKATGIYSEISLTRSYETLEILANRRA